MPGGARPASSRRMLRSRGSPRAGSAARTGSLSASPGSRTRAAPQAAGWPNTSAPPDVIDGDVVEPPSGRGHVVAEMLPEGRLEPDRLSQQLAVLRRANLVVPCKERPSRLRRADQSAGRRADQGRPHRTSRRARPAAGTARLSPLRTAPGRDHRRSALLPTRRPSSLRSSRRARRSLPACRPTETRRKRPAWACASHFAGVVPNAAQLGVRFASASYLCACSPR